MPEIIVKLGDQLLQTQAFEGDLLRVGRSRENDVVLENLSISRHHVQIRYHEGQYVLFDMNSSNGTFLNGTRVTRRELMHGDLVSIGKYSLEWLDPLPEEMTRLEAPVLDEGPGAFRARSEENRAEAWVKVETGRLKGREFRITRFETTLGKAATCDIVLTDDWLLSKKQASILRRGNDEFTIEDLGGLRKVKVNGRSIDEPVTIRTGDKVEIGGTKLTFYSTAAKHPSAPAQIIVKHQDEAPPENKAGAEETPESNTPDEHNEVLAEAGISRGQSDLEEIFEDVAHAAAFVRAENGNGKKSMEVKADAAGIRNENGTGNGRGHVKLLEPVGRESSSAQMASAAASPASVSDEHNSSVNDKEVQVWESALNNPSPAIRRQARKMLKKLTGRDYDV